MMKWFLAVLIGLQVFDVTRVLAAPDSEPVFANEIKVTDMTLAPATNEVAAVNSGTETTASQVSEATGPVKLAENEIPVNITEKKSGAAADNGLSRVLLSLGVLLITGFGLYLYMKKFMRPKSNLNQQIKVLTQHYLGPKKSLAIIRVAGESMLIGITDHNITMIKSLALLDEEIPEFSEQDFSSALEKTNSRMQADRKDMDLEDFSMKGIRDIVSKKLSNMRTLE